MYSIECELEKLDYTINSVDIEPNKETGNCKFTFNCDEPTV